MRIVKPAHNGTYGEIAFILYRMSHLFMMRASLKIQVAYGGETSRNSAAHLRVMGKRPIGVG